MEKSKSNKTKWLHLRLSPDEHSILLQRLAKTTSRTLSEYLRKVLLDRTIIATYRNRSQDDLTQELAILNRELNAIGHNLNQVTKKLHTLRPFEEKTWVISISSAVEGILVKIIEVKGVLNKVAEKWLQ